MCFCFGKIKFGSNTDIVSILSANTINYTQFRSHTRHQSRHFLIVFNQKKNMIYKKLYRPTTNQYYKVWPTLFNALAFWFKSKKCRWSLTDLTNRFSHIHSTRWHYPLLPTLVFSIGYLLHPQKNAIPKRSAKPIAKIHQTVLLLKFMTN